MFLFTSSFHHFGTTKAVESEIISNYVAHPIRRRAISIFGFLPRAA